MEVNYGILIIEDEMIVATSIAELLENEDYLIIGIAKDAANALLMSAKSLFHPAVIICDINIEGEVKGYEVALQLKQLYNSEIIFLTAYSDALTLKQAFHVSPLMYLTKPYSDTQLLVAVRMAFHKIFELKSLNKGNLKLTEREKDIALLAAQGQTSKQIASRLGISTDTVKTHRRRMLQKNNLNSFSHLVYLLNSSKNK
jgi:DNA-binding NarL/FixJ family response regulator